MWIKYLELFDSFVFMHIQSFLPRFLIVNEYSSVK